MRASADFWLDFDQLLDRMLDGLHSRDDAQQINEILRSNPAARRRFILYVALHGQLLLGQGGQEKTKNDRWRMEEEREREEGREKREKFLTSTSFFVSVHPSFPASLSSIPSLFFSYLISAVLIGLGIFAAWLYKLPDQTQLVRQSVPSPFSTGRSEFVARVTGMIDCQFSDESTASFAGAYVLLGRKYALASGLMEISYDSGAKVILQGPCTYEVESAGGGFLSVGKLTARVEKKVAGEKKVATSANPQSPIPNPSLATSHWPLFTIKTPTAMVTDLGTEFGVDVQSDGQNEVRVFRGKVELKAIGRGSSGTKASSRAVILKKDDVAIVSPAGEMTRRDGAVAGGRVAGFVRRMPRQSDVVDLLDIVAGGAGATRQREHGIDPATGETAPVFVSKWRAADAEFHPASANALIDGVFVPNGAAGPVQLDSAGHNYDRFPETSNGVLGVIWARGANIRLTRPDQKHCFWIYAMGPGLEYMPHRRGLLMMHPNAGITFNLANIGNSSRAAPRQFNAVAGAPHNGLVDFWVFVDGRLKFAQTRLCKQDGAVKVAVPLEPNAKFLTLATTDSGNGADYDLFVLGDPVLHMANRHLQDNEDH